MKPTFLLSFFLLALAIVACDVNKKVRQDQKGVTIQVFLNETYLPNATVTLDVYQSKTNKLGTAFLTDVPNRYLGKDYPLRITRDDIQLDTTLHLRIQNRMDVYLQATKGTRNLLAKLVSEDQNTLAQIQMDTENAKILLDAAEKKIEDYLLLHPNSAVDDYLTANQNMRIQLEQITNDLENILTDYMDVITNLEEDEVIDIGQYQRIVLQAEAKMEAFIEQQLTLATSQETILSSVPDESFHMSIFFGQGKYRVVSISDQDRDRISGFISKIEKIKTESFGYLSSQDLKIKITAVGYTDGVPVGEPLEKEITPLCSLEDFIWQDPNDCLSFLRAQHILDYLLQEESSFQFEQLAIGKGSINAVNKEENADLRICNISYSIIDKKLLEMSSLINQ